MEFVMSEVVNGVWIDPSNRALSPWVTKAGLRSEFKQRRDAHARDGKTARGSWVAAMRDMVVQYGGPGSSPPEQGSGAESDGGEASGGDDQGLVPKGLIGNTGADHRESIDWVANHVGISDVKPVDAPSPFAWNLLRWVRRHADHERLFWTGLVPKVMAKADASGDGGVFTDDDRRVLGLVDGFLAKVDGDGRRTFDSDGAPEGSAAAGADRGGSVGSGAAGESDSGDSAGDVSPAVGAGDGSVESDARDREA